MELYNELQAPFRATETPIDYMQQPLSAGNLVDNDATGCAMQASGRDWEVLWVSWDVNKEAPTITPASPQIDTKSRCLVVFSTLQCQLCLLAGDGGL